jgi:microcystin-dependent protein
MSCSNCFNGCSDITSDKCVKYTGIDIPLLGIQNGDSLSYIEQTIIGFLSSTLDGTGIKPDMTRFDFCRLITDLIPTCDDVTILDIEQALGTAICTVNDLITQLTSTVDTINGGYYVRCLQDDTLTDASKIHEILQTLIDRFCIVESNLTNLTEEVHTTYVTLAELPTLIQTYLDSIAVGTRICDRMVPYSILSFYGDLTGKFDVSGAGIGEWEYIYLCNGEHGTPDLRGRIPVGVSDGTYGGAALSADIVAYPYSKGVAKGTNTITLSAAQMPIHAHTATSIVTDPTHYHSEFNSDVSVGNTTITSDTYPESAWGDGGSPGDSYKIKGSLTTPTLGRSSSELTNITVATTNTDAGLGGAHDNIQPGIGVLYIMYIP